MDKGYHAMEFTPLAIPDVVLMTPKVLGDERGFFMETFRQNEFEAHGGTYAFVQENHSRSARDVLRGLHYQVRHPQGKLVRVIRGAVWDVAVDVRAQSPSVGAWVGAYLTEENKRGLWVPPGFAHGFLVVSDEADVIYKCTEYYHPEDEARIHWQDPVLSIDWPLGGGAPEVSAADAAALRFQDAPRIGS